MAGRWMMASIQTSFAVMPALVYLFAGLSPSAVSIGTLVAFTTLQTRLFFPIQSLLGVGGRHPDLDRAVRPRLRVPRPAGRHPARRRATLDDVARRGALRRTSGSATATSWTLRDIDLDGPGRHAHRARRRDRARARRRSATSPRGSTTPSAGAVRIDGADLRELTFAALADAVGVVSQETYLFHASVRENLRFARPDATDEEIEEAARAAQIHDTIAALPDGYDTVVGERGFRFSGGEKQRIAIARTILRNPPVLVLDEATSALDVQTERAVERGARAARRGPHDDRHRPPALDRPRRRPDRRARRAARSSSAARTRSCSRSAAATRRWSRATRVSRGGGPGDSGGTSAAPQDAPLSRFAV